MQATEQALVDELDMYRTDEDYPSYIIARNPAEALKCYAEVYGESTLEETLEGMSLAEAEVKFVDAFSKDRVVAFVEEDDQSEIKHSATVREWIEKAIEEGRSFPYLFGVFNA